MNKFRMNKVKNKMIFDDKKYIRIDSQACKI